MLVNINQHMPRSWEQRQQNQGGKFVRQAGRLWNDPSVKNTALLAYRGVKTLRALINSELFQYDVNVGQLTVSGTAYIYLLNGMAQGDGQSQRTGNSILMHSLKSIEHYYTPTTNDVLMREILFIDKQQISATAPTALDILETSTATSLYNKKESSRFQILSDKLIAFDAVAHPQKVSRKTNKLGKHAIYNDVTNTAIQKNGVYKMIITAGVLTYNHFYRLNYHDN